MPTESKVIALTFDDGPDQVYTPQIAALLKQYQATSTFFVVGNRVSQYPEIVKSLGDIMTRPLSIQPSKPVFL
ncbi:polysaccharide deacetylase [Brevibacillus brevis]|nr:polysaccharide deacetylase [Brevibacillus brevis]TQK54210.1 polysaccharide deacetylase [Brevibacillus sp. AG162]VEF87304.1 Probable polysaccharide deacetylase pdaA precursor [Brevibacillus brevis]